MRRLLPAVLAGALLLAATQPAGAVVGGEPADEGEWPWQVALLDGGFVVCGGVLLALDVVVTAAHCTEGYDAGDLRVTAGSIDLDGPRRDVSVLHQHEAYDDDTTENDISILLLAAPFEGSDLIQPVAVPDVATSASLLERGAPTVVTGFGATSEDGDISPVLREAELEVIDDATCTRRYAEDGDEVFGPTQTCAGMDRGHVDACYGDSGGPLVAPADEDRSSWYLVGLVSWGAGCGRPFRPTVYTEVAAFAGWIAEHGGLGAAGATRFDDADPLLLPAGGATVGKAERYPATLRVRGFDGPVDAVSVELHGLTHERVSDLDIWLEAPDGTVVTLLSDVGGDVAIVGAEVRIDGDGPEIGDSGLPLRAKPTDREADEQRKDGQPPASLDDLVGTDAEGEWQLLVADDTDGATGSLTGWTLLLR